MSFTVCQASAGSGKTFTLVREYVRIALSERDAFRSILAITFTNKAANEMKDRVLKALAELSRGDDIHDPVIREVLLPALVSETGKSATEIGIAAGEAYQAILHNYGDFAISTIDSFSHRVIRTFAYDFGLPTGFNVELDADEILVTAVDLLLDKAGTDAEVTTLLVNFLESRMEEDRDWRIENILTAFARMLLEEEGRERIRSLSSFPMNTFRMATDALLKDIRQFEQRLVSAATGAMTSLARAGLEPGDLYYGEKGIWGYFQAIASGRLDRLEANSYVVTTVTQDKWHSPRCSPAAGQALTDLIPLLKSCYSGISEAVGKGKPLYVLGKLLSRTLYPLAVLNEINKLMEEYKRQNNLVHISEFNQRIASVVMNEPVPFIFERLGERFRHILIDEFQDTSLLQWQNFVPLVENALSGGHFNLVVGDGKQAVYRWRGGDAGQFTMLPALPGSESDPLIFQRESVLRQHHKSVILETNYRSRETIVDFNNRFFRLVSDQVLDNGKKKVFDKLEQQASRGKGSGCVTLRFLRPNDEQAEYGQETMDQVEKMIRDALARNFRLSEIAVLCRSNHAAGNIARYLIDRGIGVVSAESLLLQNSPSVRFLISVMTWLSRPGNPVVEEEIGHFLREKGGEIRELTPADEGRYLQLSLYELGETLVRDFSLDPVHDPYVRFFLDALLTYSVRKPSSLHEFLAWWDKKRQTLSVRVPSETDAVRIMTIHKAKGLEFPVVILPFAHGTLKPTRNWLWIDLEPDMADGLPAALLPAEKVVTETPYGEVYEEERRRSRLDMLNLLYVAMTRASDELCILTKWPSESNDDSSLPGFFRTFLKATALWDGIRTEFRFGDPVVRPSGGAGSGSGVTASKSYPATGWRGKIRLRTKSPGGWSAGQESALNEGITMHEILSWIRDRNDLQKALEKAVLKGMIRETETGYFQERVRAVLDHPDLSSLFDPGNQVFTEAEILLPGGMTCRPDRVVIAGEKVTVLDYKTGSPMTTHAGQLARYAACLREMGYRDPDMKLVYLGGELTVTAVGGNI